jgi:hypothetical protein
MTIEELDEKVRTGEVTLTKEQEHALAVKRNIVKWYYDNDVSTTGIKTLAAWETEQALAQQWADAQWQKYQAALASAENKAEDANMFIKLDKEGHPMYDGTSVELLDFRTMSAEALSQYLSETGLEGKSQIFGYVDGLVEGTVIDYIRSATKVKDSEGKETIKINKDKLTEALTSDARINELKGMLSEYTYSTNAGESTVDITVDKEGNIKVTVSDSNSTKPIQEGSEPTVEDVDGSIVTSWESSYTKESVIWAGAGNNLQITYNEKTYSVPVVWCNVCAGTINGVTFSDWADSEEELKEKYSNPKDGEIKYFENMYWIYSSKLSSWGIIREDKKDDNAQDAEAFINALNNR